MMTVAAKPGEPAQRVEGLFVRQEEPGKPPGAGEAAKPPAKPAPDREHKP